MRTEQLEYIATVTRLGSLRRAGEELQMSAPALSETVSNLERELGISILDRKRSGATISAAGRELLPYIVEVLDAVDRLRSAANEQHQISRMIRLGTVNAATAPLLAPTIQAFRQAHPTTQIEVTGAQQSEIRRALLEGSLDLGLITCLEDDDLAPDLESTELLRGRAVVCMRSDSPLAASEAVATDDLLAQPLIVMRAGYLMHRYIHRLLKGRAPSFSYSTDGAEMGKLMVAEGLGATVLPDFSVIGDPLERHGVITYRPLRDDHTAVLLAIQRRRAHAVPPAARGLHRLFVERAQDWQNRQ